MEEEVDGEGAEVEEGGDEAPVLLLGDGGVSRGECDAMRRLGEG